MVQATLLACVFAVPAAWGTDPSEANASVAEESAETSNKTRYLLMENDRIAYGVVEAGDQCYYLVRSGGRIRYDAKQVVHVADSLEQLYQFKAANIPPHDIGERFKLHRWCLQNHLDDQAMGELRQILEVDPSHEEVARILRAMEERRKAPLIGSKGTTPTARTVRSVQTPPNEVIESFIRGHGKETFERFNSVERVLVNRCASTACHGSIRHTGEFRLFRATDGRVKDQRMTARNLQALLASVDLRKPEESPLLAYAVNAHGNAGVAPLGGVNDPMYKQLRDWVYEVADGWANDTEFLAKKRPTTDQRAGDGDFASDRVDPSNTELHPRYQRPELPGSAPGPSRPLRGSLSATADDAPEPPAPPVNRRSPRNVPTDFPSIEETAPAGDPFDPSGFNQGAKPTSAKMDSQGASKDKVQADADTSQDDVPEVLQSFEIPNMKTGEIFKAAPLPLSLQNRQGNRATKANRADDVEK
ncbi:MAG: hypothetical protein U1D30_02035 [Planctomycetota bacterium]